MNVYTTLLIAAIKDRQPHFVTHNNCWLPSVDMDEEGRDGCCKQACLLLKEITGVEAYDPDTGFGWAILKVNNVYENDGSLFIVYSTLLPEQIKLSDDCYKWTSMASIENLNEVMKNIVLKSLVSL